MLAAKHKPQPTATALRKMSCASPTRDGNEPLHGFVDDADQCAREQRPDDGGSVVHRPPRTVEQPREDPVSMKCTCSTTSTCRLPVATIRAYTTAPPTATARPVNRHRRRSWIFTIATSSATITTAAIALAMNRRKYAGKVVMSADRISPTNGDDRMTATLATLAVARRGRLSLGNQGHANATALHAHAPRRRRPSPRFPVGSGASVPSPAKGRPDAVRSGTRG